MTKSRGITISAGLLAGMSGIFLVCNAARAADVTVAMDEMHLVTFTTPVKTVLVGNPLIADVTVIDPRRVFILGKNFGTTNIVALGQNGAVISDQEITVLGRQGQTVTVQRGLNQTTLDCSGPLCHVAPVPGDDAAPFDAITGQQDKRESQVKAAVGE